MTTLNDFFKDDIRIPSPPSIAVRIIEAVKKDDVNINELARIISSDPALAAKILMVANSSLKPFSQILQEANEELGKLNLSYEQLTVELKRAKEKAEKFAQQLKKANRQLREMAFRDGLTGLYNHRYFKDF